MKKFIILTALALTASAAFTGIDAKKKSKKEKVVEPVVVPVTLTSGSDSVSYAGGMAMTNGLLPYLVQQGVDTAYMADFIRGFKEIVEGGDNPQRKAYAAGMEIANQVKGRMLPGMTNEFKDSPDSIIANVFYRGFVDALCGDKTHFEVTAAENYFRQKQEVDKKAKEERLYGPNREAGVKFLAENAKKDSVLVTPSGLQYKVLVKGEGEVPQATDKVLVNYEGRLIDGTVFDASSKHGSDPVSFAANQVIPGWTEALTMMPVGSKWQLFIPQELAYGNRNAGQIKPYSALIFDVELVGIDRADDNKADAEPAATPKKDGKSKPSAAAVSKKGGKRKK